MKKILAVVLALSLVFSAMAVMPTKAYAAENDADTSIAKKTSTAVDEDGRFQVEIQVPGGDGKEYHDEVIVMVDGSYSTDDDWSTTRNAILEIGKTVLEGSGNTLLTVMTFGMGDNVVLQHVASVAELDATLTQLPGGLLYGRSSTNCEAGFTGISEYIASHDGTLNEVHVVYITDGEINTDESTHVFYNWTQNTWLKKDAVTLAQWAIDEELALFTGGMTVLSNAYLTVFGDYSYTSEDSMLEEVVLQSEDDTEESTLEEPETEEVIPEEPETEEVIPEEPETEEVIPEEPETEEVIPEEPETEEVIPEEPETEEVILEEPETEEVISEAALTAQVARVEKTLVSSAISEEETLNNLIISDEKAMQWAAQVWADVYEYSGMSPENAYTVSDVERAFVKYDKENNTHIQEMFYYALWGRTYPDRYTRTPVAGLALAAHENVAHLYMVDSNSATSWMASMVNSAGNVSFYEAGSVSNLLTALEGVLTNLSYTPYNDVVVTDYMSKWVNLDKTSLKILDNNLGKTIWTSTEGWLISENLPTSRENPVIVEEVPNNQYVQGGPDVVGNENGTIYKLIWYVKDGAMLRNHNYSLVYQVDVDTQEIGFEYNTYYPANGNTTIDYTEKNGDEIIPKTEDIAVPDVIANKEPEPETVTIQGTKTWKDEGNEDKRPESITVRLNADGKEVASKKVTATDNWKYMFEGMPKHSETGNEIVYTVSEDAVANYKTEVKGYDIENIYDVPDKEPEPKPETVTIQGTKTWKDEGNEDKRPESITVRLNADGKEVASRKVTAADNWKYLFEGMPKHSETGNEIVYTVSEDAVANYKTEVKGYDIVNIYDVPDKKPEPKPETVTIQGTKIWKDQGNEDKRPESITVRLKADGKEIASKKVTAADNWKYLFEGMPKHSETGNEIVYTVSEDAVANYKTEVKGYDIVNIYDVPDKKPEPKPETVTIRGTKTWKDQGNEDKRPESITVRLKADGKEVASKKVTAADNWKYSFKNVPKCNKAGKKIVYTVSEDPVANYKTKVKGYDIENIYQVRDKKPESEKPQKPNSDETKIPVQLIVPKTGEDILIFLVVIIAVVSGIALIILTKSKGKTDLK